MEQGERTDRPLPAEAPEPLSRFEGQCLWRRTCECEELLQLAVLGVEHAREQHPRDDNLAEIAAHLAEAERHAELAHKLALKWSA